MKNKLMYLSFLLVVYFAGCVKDKEIISTHYIDETPCTNNESIGIWNFVGLEGKYIRSIAIHPQKSNILLIGTSMNFSAGEKGRLYFSLDCGKNWETNIEGNIFKITHFDSINTNIVYTSPSALVRSINGGITWSNISRGITLNWETYISSFQIDPFDNQILYVGTSGFLGGSLYKSINSGQDWTVIANEEMSGNTTCMAVDPTNSDIIYTSSAAGCLFKSTDQGATWQKTGLSTSGKTIYDIIVNPLNSQQIFASSNGIYFSGNNGENWIRTNRGLPLKFICTNLCFDKVSGDLYCTITSGDSSAIYKKNYNEEEWLLFGLEDLNISSYYSELIISPDNKYIYYGTQGKGLYRLKLR